MSLKRSNTDCDAHKLPVRRRKFPALTVYTFPLSPPPSPPPRSSPLSFRKPSPPEVPTTAPVQASPFLQLPTDVLYLIADHLDRISARTLTLACRSTYALNLPAARPKLDQQDERQLLLLLERDALGEGHFYCNGCNKLHPFEPYWAPHSPREMALEPAFHCGQRNRFNPCGNDYNLAFYHARLVMNAHLYGPAHGLPLDSIAVAHDVRRDAVTIRCTTAARVIHDELFLRRTYAFAVPAAAVPALRASTGAADFRICEHTPFFRSSSVYHQCVAELARRPAAPGVGTVEDGLVECHRSPGACGLCLMDYDVSIAQQSGTGGAGWDVTIVAYHQVGACRSPDDWKWARFTEKGRPHFFLPNRPNRRGSSYHPGSVMEQWFATP